MPPAPRLSYSRWIKRCRPNNPDGKTVCYTMKGVGLSNGYVVASATFYDYGDQKWLRVTLPPNVRHSEGARVFVDTDAPQSAGFARCLPAACIADFKVDTAFVDKLKTGQQLHLQGFIAPGEALSYRLLLGGFAEAFEGPPAAPRPSDETSAPR